MRTNLTKKLFNISPEAPISATELDRLGIDSSVRNKYLKSGRLLLLKCGVYSLPNAKINRESAIEFLQNELGNIHIGGRSALAINGILHNIPAKEILHFWGVDRRKKIPEWFDKLFPARYTSKSPFSADFDFGITRFGDTKVRVSSSERALFEVLDSVGTLYSVEESKNLFDLVLSPRKKVLETLISNCKRLKVLRLLGNWGKELNVEYADFLIKTIRPYDSKKHLNVVLNDKTVISLPPL